MHAYTQIENFADRQKDREGENARLRFTFTMINLFVRCNYNVFVNIREREVGGRERENK